MGGDGATGVHAGCEESHRCVEHERDLLVEGKPDAEEADLPLDEEERAGDHVPHGGLVCCGVVCVADPLGAVGVDYTHDDRGDGQHIEVRDELENLLYRLCG